MITRPTLIFGAFFRFFVRVILAETRQNVRL
jgi:hypothetical protein